MTPTVIGNCRLYLGDCAEILPALTDVDSIVSDPPYGIDYQSGHATDDLWGDDRTIAQDKDTIARDMVVEWSASRPTLLFGSWKRPRPAGTKMVLVWDKGGALGMGDLSLPWKPDHEEIYVIGSGFIGSRDSGSVLRCPPVQSMAKNGRLHPTQKPVALMERLVRKVPGVVLDPFMGSGSTGVACAKLGRSFVGIETKAAHFATASRRIEEVYRQGDFFVAAPALAKQEAFL